MHYGFAFFALREVEGFNKTLFDTVEYFARCRPP